MILKKERKRIKKILMSKDIFRKIVSYIFVDERAYRKNLHLVFYVNKKDDSKIFITTEFPKTEITTIEETDNYIIVRLRSINRYDYLMQYLEMQTDDLEFQDIINHTHYDVWVKNYNQALFDIEKQINKALYL